MEYEPINDTGWFIIAIQALWGILTLWDSHSSVKKIDKLQNELATAKKEAREEREKRWELEKKQRGLSADSTENFQNPN